MTAPPPEVSVTNALTGAGVCDASVVATQGMTATPLSLQGQAPDGGACTYGSSQFGRPGTYEVSVAAGGFKPASQSVEITVDSCGNTNSDTSVVVALSPSP